jgi:hypothetical protein
MNPTKRILFFLLVVLGIAGIVATVYFLFIKKDVLVTTALKVNASAAAAFDIFVMAIKVS